MCHWKPVAALTHQLSVLARKFIACFRFANRILNTQIIKKRRTLIPIALWTKWLHRPRPVCSFSQPIRFVEYSNTLYCGRIELVWVTVYGQHRFYSTPNGSLCISGIHLIEIAARIYATNIYINGSSVHRLQSKSQTFIYEEPVPFERASTHIVDWSLQALAFLAVLCIFPPSIWNSCLN